ncbi:MAG: flagellar biosynthetic protein FliR [Hungatella sp.]|jgi:flagellar biosynthetic protein FliR|nr:flagellar biosynthetic protein FliR [Hungatella sp.]
MLILFALVVMRMSGAVVFNPVLGRTNLPRTAKGAMVLMLSLLLYLGVEGNLQHQPANLIEFGVMLLKELMVGFVIGYSMELGFMVIRFASSIIDQTMGLSMAQTYDPQYNTQMTITSNLYYAFLFLLFLAGDGHVRLLALFFSSARLIPFGQVTIDTGLARMMLETFTANITMGLQLAFPIIAMELVTEAAVGILMRMIPQINVFAVNFQLKIIVGLMMLLFMFSPMSERLYVIIDNMFMYMQQLFIVMS